MPLTHAQIVIMTAAVALGAMTARFLPFLIFREGRRLPKYIKFLGKTLPCAMTGLLVVYSLKGVSLTSAPYGIPEAVSVAVVAALQLWKNNALLSIGAGTAAYMLLLRLVFA